MLLVSSGLEAEDAFDHPIISGPPFSQAVICPSLGYADPGAGSGSVRYVEMGAATASLLQEPFALHCRRLGPLYHQGPPRPSPVGDTASAVL